MLKLFPVLAIVPISLLLTASFFVLLDLRKIEEKGLKAFGYVVASLLWLAALVVFAGAAYDMGRGHGGMRCMMQQKMKMGTMPQMMMQQGNMPGMAMPEKGALPKDEKRPASSKCGGNKGIIFKAE